MPHDLSKFQEEGWQIRLSKYCSNEGYRFNRLKEAHRSGWCGRCEFFDFSHFEGRKARSYAMCSIVLSREKMVTSMKT